MRIGIKLMLVVAAALVAAAPAHAQRQSLADRVGAIEQQMYNNSANQDLLNQINQLRQQVTSLQASIEQLQHDNAQLKQSAQDQYLDLDSRLNRLEGGNAAPALPPVPASAPKAAPAPAKPAAAATSERPPSVHGDAGSLAATGDERTSYNVAFDSLKAGKYDDSAQLFLSFLQLYPNGVYAPNALYWLGESYYATRNFPMAETQFRELLALSDPRQGRWRPAQGRPLAIRRGQGRPGPADAGDRRGAVPWLGRRAHRAGPSAVHPPRQADPLIR